MAIYRMTEAEKTKLDGIATSANNYSHPTQTEITANATDNGINVIDSVTVNTLGHVTAVGTRDLSNVTTSAAGVMSAADKIKLNNFTTGVNWALFAGSQVINKASTYAFATNMSKLKSAYLEIDITGVSTLKVSIDGNGAWSGIHAELTMDLETTSAGVDVTYTAGTPASITITEIRFYPFGSQ